MTMHTDSAAHLRDAELMRLLDGEETATERARSASHVAMCPRCARAAERLRADAATVRGWLDRAGFEDALPHVTGVGADAAPILVPGVHRSDVVAVRVAPARASAAARGWRNAAPWLRAAAVIALLATPVAAVPSVRERIVDAIGELRGSRPAAVPATREAAAATVWFEPAAGAFTVLIDAPQATGTLRVGEASGEEAVLQIGGDAGAGPVVSASTLHIRNLPGTRASYVLRVPSGVTSVTIRIGDRIAAVLDESAVRSGAELQVR
jgi:anti-sigma factor RsiW